MLLFSGKKNATKFFGRTFPRKLLVYTFYLTKYGNNERLMRLITFLKFEIMYRYAQPGSILASIVFYAECKPRLENHRALLNRLALVNQHRIVWIRLVPLISLNLSIISDYRPVI